MVNRAGWDGDKAAKWPSTTPAAPGSMWWLRVRRPRMQIILTSARSLPNAGEGWNALCGRLFRGCQRSRTRRKGCVGAAQLINRQMARVFTGSAPLATIDHTHHLAGGPVDVTAVSSVVLVAGAIRIFPWPVLRAGLHTCPLVTKPIRPRSAVASRRQSSREGRHPCIEGVLGAQPSARTDADIWIITPAN
jgi:hypothetical protein